MGLNLNTPQTKNYTGLNPVRSGSTTEPDYSVKYVPQTLTEDQQAQARENIGAAAAGEGGQQIQSDWAQTNTSAVDYIKNKPTIPAAQVQSDWNQTDDTAVDYIKNKPAMATDEIPEDREGVITIYSNVDTDLHADHINDVVKFYQNGILYTGTYTNNNIPIKKGKNVLVTTSWSPNGYRFNDTNSDTVYNIVVNAGQNDFLDGTYNGIVNIILTGGSGRDSINNGRAQGPNVRYYILRNNAPGRYLERGQTVFVDYPFFNRYNSFQANPQWNPSATNTGTAYVPRSRKEEFERGMAASISDATELANALTHVKYYDFLTFDPNYNVSMITL